MPSSRPAAVPFYSTSAKALRAAGVCADPDSLLLLDVAPASRAHFVGEEFEPAECPSPDCELCAGGGLVHYVEGDACLPTFTPLGRERRLYRCPECHAAFEAAVAAEIAATTQVSP